MGVLTEQHSRFIYTFPYWHSPECGIPNRPAASIRTLKLVGHSPVFPAPLARPHALRSHDVPNKNQPICAQGGPAAFRVIGFVFLYFPFRISSELAPALNCIDHGQPHQAVVGMSSEDIAFCWWFKSVQMDLCIICLGQCNDLIEIDRVSVSGGAIL